MRRLIFVVCILTIILASSSVALANPPIGAEQAIMKDFLSLSQDSKQAVEMWGYKNKSEIPVKVGKPYQVFDLHTPTVKGLAGNYEIGSFKNALINSPALGSPFWEYPLLDQAGKASLTVEVKESAGKVSVGRMGPSLSNEMIELSTNEDKLRNRLEEQGITGITSVTNIRETFGLDYLYITTRNSDFLMPISSPGGDPIGEMGFEIGKAFPAKDVVLKIADRVKVPATDKPPTTWPKREPRSATEILNMKGGGAFSSPDNQAPAVNNTDTVRYALTAGIVALPGAAIWLLMRRRKNASTIV